MKLCSDTVIKKYFSFIFAVGALLTIAACSEDKTDEERVQEIVNSTSVYITTGLKIITVNPNDAEDIAHLQDKVLGIINAENPQAGDLTLAEMGELAKVLYQAKALGEQEVQLGKQSTFQFFPAYTGADQGQLQKLSAEWGTERDHGLSLVLLYLMKTVPTVPIPVSNKAVLYEAWMAGDARYDSDYLNLFVQSLQASTFADYELCDFAQDRAKALSEVALKPADLKTASEALVGMGRAAAHAPQAAPILLAVAAVPVVIEVLPGLVRVKAHIDTASCLEQKGDTDGAQQQQQQAITALEQMGIPEAETALLRAGIAYKQNDLEATAKYLRQADSSQILDKRSKQDLKVLADNLDKPDKKMLERYFSSATVTWMASQIIHKRLKDEGVYDKLLEAADLQRLSNVASALVSSDLADQADGLMDDTLDMSKGLLDKATELVK